MSVEYSTKVTHFFFVYCASSPIMERNDQRGIPMLQHFKFKPMFEDSRLPGWNISFFYRNERIRGEYHPDGSIVWQSAPPQDEEAIKKMVHELMLYHVYD